MYGTCQCPHIVATLFVGGGTQPVICAEVAEVSGPDADGGYEAVCPAGHVVSFGAPYLTNVTPV